MSEIVVYDKPSGGTPLQFDKESRLVASGGEGAVYAVSVKGKKIAIKLFNEQKLEKEGECLAQKINDMMDLGLENSHELINYPRIAWPQVCAYDANGKFIGYGMRLAKGTTMNRLAHLKLYEDKKYFLDMDRDKMAKMLIDVWKSVSFLHERGICIGDINLNNVLCTKSYGICWIDADSFQVEKPDKSGNWRCLVGRPDMIPPEHSGKKFEDIDRTIESDLFSLAILSFQCLMLGRHPYDHIGGGDMSDTMRKGYFPYVTGGAVPGTPGGIPKGPWHVMWSHYTYNLKELFVRALREGARDPSERPSADEWVKGFKGYLKKLNSNKPAPTEDGGTFWHTRDMIPAEEKPKLKHRGSSTKG